MSLVIKDRIGNGFMSNLLGIIFTIHSTPTDISNIYWWNKSYTHNKNLWTEFFDALTCTSSNEIIRYRGLDKRSNNILIQELKQKHTTVTDTFNIIFNSFKLKSQYEVLSCYDVGIYIRTTDASSNRLASKYSISMLLDNLPDLTHSNVFIASDSENELQKVTDLITCSNIHFNSCHRSLGGIGSPGHREWINDSNGLELAKEVMNDCIHLSKCKTIYMIGGGNVTLMAAVMNPNIVFKCITSNTECNTVLAQNIFET